MGVDHRGLDVIMAQEFLNGPNIVTGFEQNAGRSRFLGMHPISQNQDILLHQNQKAKTPSPFSGNGVQVSGILAPPNSKKHLANDSQRSKPFRQLEEYLLLFLPIYRQSANTDCIILNDHDCPSKQRPFDFRPEIFHPDKKMIRVGIP